MNAKLLKIIVPTIKSPVFTHCYLKLAVKMIGTSDVRIERVKFERNSMTNSALYFNRVGLRQQQIRNVYLITYMLDGIATYDCNGARMEQVLISISSK